MFPVNVLMFEDNVGLVAVTHTFHVFLRDVPELIVGQSVFRRGVQRGVEDRVRSPAVGFEVRPKAIHAGVDIHSPVLVERFQHPLPEEHLGFILIHFFLVVTQGPAGCCPGSYIRNHSLACLARCKNLDTKGLQLACSLFQHGDLMRDSDIGKVGIDDLYDLIVVVGEFLKLEIKIVQPGDELRLRRIAFDDYKFLAK